MTTNTFSLSVLDEFMPESIGHDMLRYISLPDIFGAEAHTLLYFTGKNLARKIELGTMEDIYYTFDKLGWGRLELNKSKKRTMSFFLMSDEIVKRIESPIETDFRLEAGFLAEAIQKVVDRPCECTEEINERLFRITFNIVFTDK